MNFTELLDQYHLPYDDSGRNKNRPGWINFTCVVCGRHPYMGYHIASRSINAWCCGRVSLLDVVAKITDLPLDDCLALIEEIPRQELPDRIKKIGSLKLPHGVGRLRAMHKSYLVLRGFDPKEIEKFWGVQGTGILGGKYSWRLFIPVHLHGEIVSFTTRAIGDKQPRYLSATDEESTVSIRDCVYGIDYCRHDALIVEGPADVWAGGPGTVALMNSNPSAAQIEQLSRIPQRTVCFDSGPGEYEAQERARQLAKNLSVFPGLTQLVTLETGKDLASCSQKEREHIRRRFLT